MRLLWIRLIRFGIPLAGAAIVVALLAYVRAATRSRGQEKVGRRLRLRTLLALVALAALAFGAIRAVVWWSYARGRAEYHATMAVVTARTARDWGEFAAASEADAEQVLRVGGPVPGARSLKVDQVKLETERDFTVEQFRDVARRARAEAARWTREAAEHARLHRAYQSLGW
jgi:hypothetical protein